MILTQKFFTWVPGALCVVLGLFVISKSNGVDFEDESILAWHKNIRGERGISTRYIIKLFFSFESKRARLLDSQVILSGSICSNCAAIVLLYGFYSYSKLV